MNTAELCWVILGGIIVLLAVIFFIANIPELRRYMRIRSM